MATRWLTASTGAIALIAAILKATPFFYQVNGDIISLTMPVNLAIAFIAWKLSVAPATKTVETAGGSESISQRTRAKSR